MKCGTNLRRNFVIVQDRHDDVGKILSGMLTENLDKIEKEGLGRPLVVNKVDVDGDVGVPVAGSPEIERQRKIRQDSLYDSPGR